MKKYAFLFFLIIGIVYPSDIYIIFTANVNGILEDCRCGNEPLGGLARVKSFVSQFKEEHPNTLFIDGGDFLNPYKFPDLNLAMSDILREMNYDLITAGDQEFIEGYDLFKMHLDRYNPIILATNCNFGQTIFQKKVAMTPVVIQSYLSPKCFSFIEKPAQIHIDTVRAVTFSESAEDLNVLLYHGEARYAEDFIKQSAGIDLVLLGHAQRIDSWEFNGVTFVGGCLDTELIMVVAATRTTGKWAFTVTSHKMDQSVVQDTHIKQLVEQWKMGRKER